MRIFKEKRVIVIHILVVVVCFFVGCSKEVNKKRITNGSSVSDSAVSGSAVSTLIKEEKYEFTEKAVKFDDVVWTAYEEKMTSKEYEVLLEYIPILTEGRTICWTSGDGQVFKGENTIKDAFVKMYEAEDISFKAEDLEVLSVQVCDLTGDGDSELVLNFIYSVPSHVIIHKEGEKYYGIALAKRWFQAPCANGVFSMGKGYNDTKCRLIFENEKFKIKELAHYEADMVEERFWIDEKEVNKKSYEKWCKENIVEQVKEYYPAQRI